ncbi:NAD(P)-binding protein [Daldinia loculata]|uniref:NAD(P)-binding protein n=1 Tax=Daldinia loculata TaxID=103429 RepID=UPI0020C50068|nr:NAD(P)-binding protein [Daldinia loculata]KAI1643195.1 NAD(P)-binding protein [Daldinia loculata]KAI2779438.1 NAD(P)-binding protein [Daldinia loculata]
MSSRINTILIIGATSGIGEAFARRFHSLGKKVIVTGRRQDKLDALAQELQGLETRQFDIADLTSLAANVESILKDFPRLDSVIINAGIQKSYSLFDPSTSSPEAIINEINTDLTAPSLLVRLFAPHLFELAKAGNKTNLFLTTSALAYVPLSFYPAYCSSKAGLQTLAKILRQQLSFAPEEAKKNLSIVEIIPPYVDTGLDHEHRENLNVIQGGSEKAYPPMPLDEYINEAFDSLEQLEQDGSFKKEIGVGLGKLAEETWRGSFGKVFEQMGLTV